MWWVAGRVESAPPSLQRSIKFLRKNWTEQGHAEHRPAFVQESLAGEPRASLLCHYNLK